MPLGIPELVLILVIVLSVFGAGRLPQIGSSLGKGIREFREATEDRTPPAPPAPPTVTTTVLPPVPPVSSDETKTL